MSTNSDRKRPIGRPVVKTRLVNRALCEKAFTIIELLTVITIIGVMLLATTIVWETTARNMDVQGAAEMFKEDIRKVYTMAGLGLDSSGINHRDQWSLKISTSGAVSPNTPNCYQICTRPWSVTGWGEWSTSIPQNAEANKILTGGWIKPNSMSMSIDILDPNTGQPLAPKDNPTYPFYYLIFESMGSVVVLMPNTDSTGLTPASAPLKIRLKSPSKQTDIIVSVYGDVS